MFILRFKGEEIGRFTERRDAMMAFEPHRRDKRYTLHFASPVYRRVLGTEMVLNKKDRARGKSALLRGTHSSGWSMTTSDHVVETRIR